MSKVIGYFQSWNRYTKCAINDIDASLYTHLIYAFAGIKGNKIDVIDKWGDIEDEGFLKFTNAAKAKGVTPMLAIGGWNLRGKPFSKMARTEESRKEFIADCLRFCKKYKFEGIDLDWEYPGLNHGGHKDDAKNFSLLLEEMADVFDSKGYELSAAVAAGSQTMEKSYEVTELNNYLDFINLMAYDIHVYDKNTTETGHNAPLYSDDENNVTQSVLRWLDAGIDSDKLVLGIPAYGRGYELKSKHVTHIGAPCVGSGDYPSIGYDEVLDLQHGDIHWHMQWDSFQQVPYMFHHKQWIGYDNPDSIMKKGELVQEYDLGGVMIYSIDTDNPKGSLRFPLTKAAISAME